jgi:amidophosphoribosyltransferase
MSDPIKHECGIAFIRLLKPLGYYFAKYGTAAYALNKMYLLMEKQHNRGQDGAGVASIKLDGNTGAKYINRSRSVESSPIQDIFADINSRIHSAKQMAPNHEESTSPEWLKENAPFMGELILGHLRYGTYGGNTIANCHPFIRRSNWRSRTLMLAGNFNLTNVNELFRNLVSLGQFPEGRSDSVTMLEKIGHWLEEENNQILNKYRSSTDLTDEEIYRKIEKEMDIADILKRSCSKWDGGYVACGMFGHGDAFITRDPWGIRPVHYYQDDEIVIVTSERPPIQTAFNIPKEKIKEIKPGAALIIRKDGTITEEQIREPGIRNSCSFERIYFSRGSDTDIYKERKALGAQLLPQVLESVENNIENTVFSYIPNTAETAFYGLIEETHDYCNKLKTEKILGLGKNADQDEIRKILAFSPRMEKIAIKDAKLRTFIADDKSRDDLVAHVYDTTYGVVVPNVDNLVILDDSIVRGTTLKQSIIRILDKLNPKKIVVVSSAPQIRYPDCYGIDMAKLNDFIAFKAAISLLKERGLETLIAQVYDESRAMLLLPDSEMSNVVQKIYEPFSDEEVSIRIAELLRPENVETPIDIIYQTLEGLHNAVPNDKGDWYFSGNFPTPGGNRVVCQSFVNYIENRNTRAY